MSVDFKKFAEELRCSGVSIASQYLGSVPVFESMRNMVNDMRMQLVSECIVYIACQAGILEETDPINPIVARLIGEPKVENIAVELNITSKMIKVIHNTRLIQRHPVQFFSHGAQGRLKTEKMFGYIAKNKNGEDRRCHVFANKENVEVQKLIDVLTVAINVNTADVQQKMDENGFVAPTAPLRTRNGEHRQSFVSNVRPAPVMEDVRMQAWYHGNLSRESAQALLTTPGDFLVRQSDHTPGQFVLSGRVCENEHKHLILLDKHGRVRTRDKQFNNISELIEYHMNNGMAVRSEGKDRETSLNLIRPIPLAQ